jgi:hypothetical protein
MDIEELETWFQDRPKWLQDAARRIVQYGDLTEPDYAELLDICKGEVTGQSPTFTPITAGALTVQDTTRPLRLESIGDVRGVNALSPTRPLEFGKGQLCIVYGRNGTGKSGYVRLLKHACGVRHPGDLKGDIFSLAQGPQSASFTFHGGTETKKSTWTGGAVPELQGVDIYDTACGLIYVNDENEVTFEPWLLRLFTRLTDSCTNLSKRIKNTADGLVSKKPDLPPAYASTKAGAWYLGISVATTSQNVDHETSWTTAHETELGELKKRLAEANPAAIAASLRRRMESVLKLKNELHQCSERLSKERCEEYVDLKVDAVAKRRAADEDARKVFESSPLGGLGSESWRLLWAAARRYSEEVYGGLPFPNVSENARCVLCLRPLDEESRGRFISFEEFVKGELQRLAADSDKKAQDAEALFPDAPRPDTLNTKMDAAGIEDAAVRAKVNDLGTALVERKRKCLVAARREELPPTPPSADTLGMLDDFAKKFEEEAIACDEDAKGQNRTELEAKARELSAREWLSQQRKAISEEIKRLPAVAILAEMERLTDTHALSLKKGKLTEELITAAYIHRFLEELNRLEGSHVKVELARTKAAVGHVYHKISLRGAKQQVRTSEILSEGEFRVVSLAAFLADAEGRGAKTPFIFDDPISSLDHEYEEATAQRLVGLTPSRQVIVFTHRLSLVGFLEKYAKKINVKPSLVCLGDYKMGDVGELPINLRKTNSTVNDLLNTHLKGIREAFDQGGEAYEREASAMCRNVRILLERIVEKDLLNEVVSRFSPEVQTKDKIQALAKITREDCNFIDDYMTKYSRYEHSQPEEAPVKLPPPEEIERDLKELAEFIKKIKERNNQ